MSETLTPLSLNEICFYFRRAAVSWPLRSGGRVALELNPDTATVVGLGSEDIGSPEPARTAEPSVVSNREDASGTVQIMALVRNTS